MTSRTYICKEENINTEFKAAKNGLLFLARAKATDLTS